MELTRNKKILLVLLGLLVLAGLLKFVGLFQKPPTQAEATSFVLDDLKSKYPESQTEIMTIVNKTNDNGGSYFEVKARVTQNPNTPCPDRSHIYYNYPLQNFVPQTPQIITRDCHVCTEGICTIAFDEEAIIASHTLNGTTDVQNYLMQNRMATPLVRQNNDTWAVDWTSNASEYGYEVVMHRSGRILNVQRIPATQVN